MKCSFCDKGTGEVAFMVAREGAEPDRPAICDECVFGAAKQMVAAGWRPPTVAVEVKMEPEPEPG